MKIVVVGGGISGLYCANLLESNGHKITVIENKKWGGCIQTDSIDGVPYSISVLAFIGDNKNFNKFFEDNSYKSTDYKSEIKGNYTITCISVVSVLYFLLTGLFSYLLGSSLLGTIGIMVLLLILLLVLIRPTGNPIRDGNIIKKTLLFNMGLPMERAFGSVKTDEQFLNIIDNYSILDINRSAFKNAQDIITSLMENPKISYIVDDIKSISYEYGKLPEAMFVKMTSGIITCDKVIMACDYDSYSHILKLDEFSRLHLSDTENFDFYSTLIRTDGEFNIELSNKILAYFQYDKNTYLCASWVPLGKSDFWFIVGGLNFIRSYKWKMGFLRTNENRRIIADKINGKNNVHFIGNSISLENGVSSCMDFVESHLLKHKLITNVPVLKNNRF